MSPALISIIMQFGGPILRRIIDGKIGEQNGELIGMVVDRIAERAGIESGMVEAAAEANPELIRNAVAEVETAAPELIALYARELETKAQLLAAEDDGPLWMRAWRPLGMYLIGFLWLWNIVILHVANAIWKIALPPADTGVLLQLSAIYMGLYMGGHTVKASIKDLISKRGTST